MTETRGACPAKVPAGGAGGWSGAMESTVKRSMSGPDGWPWTQGPGRQRAGRRLRWRRGGRRGGRLAVLLSIIAGCATPLAAAAQDEEAGATALEGGSATAGAESDRERQPIAFNFKEAPYSEVLDFFSRESGLPLIKEAPAPGATLTFISGETYSFQEALSILNQNLHMHNVHLRRE